MQLTYDPTVDAAYLALVPVPPGGVARTHPVAAWLTLDVDAAERLVGLEALDARSHLPAPLLDAAPPPGP